MREQPTEVLVVGDAALGRTAAAWSTTTIRPRLFPDDARDARLLVLTDAAAGCRRKAGRRPTSATRGAEAVQSGNYDVAV